MDQRFLRALRREPVDATPVWFMRQAGRSLPRYLELGAPTEMFQVLQDPQRAALVTALPLDYYPVDACVLYNDLSTPLLGAGFQVEMRAEVGPVVSPRIRGPGDVERLVDHDPRETMPWILEQIRILRPRLPVPILGFVGAPFTVASYLIAGPGNRSLESTRAFMRREPDAWGRLLGYWAHHLAEFGVAQHQAGAAAVQVFDSWVGCLAPGDYERFVFPHSRALLEGLREAGVPTIHYAAGNSRLLPLVAEAGGEVIALDWRIPIDQGWALVGEDRGVQGNLDPAVLLAGRDPALAATREILERVGGRPGHIFNVGHGLLPGTDPEVLRAVVDFVHAFGS